MSVSAPSRSLGSLGFLAQSLPSSVRPRPNEGIAASQTTPNAAGGRGPGGEGRDLEAETGAAAVAAPGAAQELSPEEEREVEDLRKRDREVRAHEAAHKAAAGSLSSGAASFSFTTGPDGRRYATSGEVSIDTSAVSGDPDATVRKMLQVRSAALAPANPSGQDRKVAAQASSQAQAARAEAAREKLEGTESQAEAGSSSEVIASSGEPPANETGCAICGGDGHGPEIHYARP